MADWVSIKADYVSGGVSYRELSERHGVPLGSIKRHAAAEGWAAQRTKTEPNRYQKTVRMAVQKKVGHEADRLTRLLGIGDQLADKLEQAAAELDKHLVTHKKRNRTITYGDPDAKGKPTREVIDDTEIVAVIDAPIDRMGLKQLASALKDLRDVANTPRADEESLKKVAALMAGLDAEAKEVAQDGPVKPETEGVPPKCR